MIILQLLLVLFYVFLIVLNYKAYINGKTLLTLTWMTAILSTFMLFGSNAADIDYGDNELDISGTRGLYELYKIDEYYEYNMYFIYYRCMYLGQVMGLSYRMWWALMSIIMMTVVYYACKIHQYNYNLFLATFMVYYETVFYAGFKSFYGFCFLLLAFGFLLRNTNKGRLAFAIINIIATGFHIMYFLFFLFLIKPIKKPQQVVKIVVIVSVVITVLARLKGSALLALIPMIHTKGGENTGTLDELDVNAIQMGFYLPIFIHLVTVYIVYRIRNYKIKEGNLTTTADTLYYLVLISLFFCPLYSIGLTFMRYITFFSFVVITAASSMLNDNRQSRMFCFKMSLLMVFSSYLMRIMMGFEGHLRHSVLPYFDVI